jgi:hypothetical protein
MGLRRSGSSLLTRTSSRSGALTTAREGCSRYGVLESIGPDMFFAVLDYGPRIQEFDDMVVKLDGTFRAGR